MKWINLDLPMRAVPIAIFCLISLAMPFVGATASGLEKAKSVAARFLKAQSEEDWDRCIELLDAEVRAHIKSRNSVLADLRPLPEGLSSSPLPSRNYFRSRVLIQNRQIKQKEKWRDIMIVVRKSLNGEWKVLFCHPSRMEAIFEESLEKSAP